MQGTQGDIGTQAPWGWQGIRDMEGHRATEKGDREEQESGRECGAGGGCQRGRRGDPGVGGCRGRVGVLTRDTGWDGDAGGAGVPGARGWGRLWAAEGCREEGVG